jgi:hypothetical protein
MADLRDYGPFEMAHGFDDPRKVEDDMFRIAAQNAEDANARLGAVAAQRDELLAALKYLTNESEAVLGLVTPWLREVIGNTNVTCFQGRVQDARAACAKAEGK